MTSGGSGAPPTEPMKACRSGSDMNVWNCSTLRWHQEDAPGMLRQLGLEPPTAIMRLAARRSARRYRRELAATR